MVFNSFAFAQSVDGDVADTHFFRKTYLCKSGIV